MKYTFVVILFMHLLLTPSTAARAASTDYAVGIDDVLEINILQPEKLITTVTVSPDGAITFPYIGNVAVKGLALIDIQKEIEARLSDGYMRYPVVSVFLKECRSRKFFVYGEVAKPGAYSMEEGTTVMKAIAIAGGFTKYGSANRVKILRQREKSKGYETLKVNIKEIMDGSANADILLKQGDTVVVSEGIF